MVTRRDRRLIAAASVIVLGVAAVAGMMQLRSHSASGRDATARERASLQVRQDPVGERRENGSPLRCFVDGRFAGAMALDACARKNGVSSQALDVGLEGAANATSPESSTLVAAEPGRTPGDAVPATRSVAAASEPTGGACMRFEDGGWRTVGSRMPLAACAHALYEGRCVDPGDAAYGRSGETTLRLVTGRVESSDDDRRFHFVMTQNEDCTLDG